MLTELNLGVSSNTSRKPEPRASTQERIEIAYVSIAFQKSCFELSFSSSVSFVFVSIVLVTKNIFASHLLWHFKFYDGGRCVVLRQGRAILVASTINWWCRAVIYCLRLFDGRWSCNGKKGIVSMNSIQAPSQRDKASMDRLTMCVSSVESLEAAKLSRLRCLEARSLFKSNAVFGRWESERLE